MYCGSPKSCESCPGVCCERDERRHIARELHDSAGQTLAVLGMNLGMIVQREREAPTDIANRHEQTQELVQQLTKEIRTTSYSHPPLLDENGLPAALPGTYVGPLNAAASM